jgi:anti-sigma B factor antagonist
MSDLEVRMLPHTQSPADPRFARRDAARPAFRCVRGPGGFGAASVHLRGELDLATAPQLEQTLREAQRDASLVVLDLRELEFMACAGLHVIVDAAERARRDGRRLIVLRGPAQVDRLFRLIGAADVVEISDNDPRQPATDQGLPQVAAANGDRSLLAAP